mgnify:CR=1 FL=1
MNEARFPTTPGPWAVDIPSDRRAAISVTAVIADGGAPITIAAVPFKEPKQAHMRAIAGTGVGNARLIAAGAHLGVRRILVDDTAFSPERYGPGYSATGDGASYTAPSGALSLAFNTAVATIRPTTARSSAENSPTRSSLIKTFGRPGSGCARWRASSRFWAK